MRGKMAKSIFLLAVVVYGMLNTMRDKNYACSWVINILSSLPLLSVVTNNERRALPCFTFSRPSIIMVMN